jgi:hypothetical protein
VTDEHAGNAESLRQLKKITDEIGSLRETLPGGDGIWPAGTMNRVTAYLLQGVQYDLLMLYMLWAGFFAPEVLDKYDGVTYGVEDLKQLLDAYLDAKKGMCAP